MTEQDYGPLGFAALRSSVALDACGWKQYAVRAPLHSEDKLLSGPVMEQEYDTVAQERNSTVAALAGVSQPKFRLAESIHIQLACYLGHRSLVLILQTLASDSL